MAGIARPGDLVITVGCGDVTKVAPMIVAELSRGPSAGGADDVRTATDDRDASRDRPAAGSPSGIARDRGPRRRGLVRLAVVLLVLALIARRRSGWSASRRCWRAEQVDGHADCTIAERRAGQDGGRRAARAAAGPPGPRRDRRPGRARCRRSSRPRGPRAGRTRSRSPSIERRPVLAVRQPDGYAAGRQERRGAISRSRSFPTGCRWPMPIPTTGRCSPSSAAVARRCRASSARRLATVAGEQPRRRSTWC